MEKLDEQIAAAFRKLVFLCGSLTVLTSVFVCAEVISRNFFGFSFEGVDEISGYVMSFISACGFGYAVISRSHIRIDSLLQFTRGRLHAGLDVLAYLALTWVGGLLTFHAAQVFYYSLEFMSRSQTPLSVFLWVPQLFWLIGLAGFACVAAYASVRSAIIWAHYGADRVTGYFEVDDVKLSLEEAKSLIRPSAKE